MVCDQQCPVTFTVPVLNSDGLRFETRKQTRHDGIVVDTSSERVRIFIYFERTLV